MTLLLSEIKKATLEARIARKPEASFLVTLLSEVSMPGKNAGRESYDSEVQNVVEKFMKNARSNLALGMQSAQSEIDILERFLPQQMNENDIRDAITDICMGVASPTIGYVMGELKKNYTGRYDGKTASKLVNEVLTQIPA